MKFSEQLNDVEGLDGIGFGCFNMELTKTLKNKMQIRHIAEKVDKLRELGNYGTPEQHIIIFGEACNYLAGRGIDYNLKFTWTVGNSLYFNLKCLFLLIVNNKRLKTYNI